MNYSQTLNYIHSVSNFFCKPGLERISCLCKKLGNPQDKLKFIHVAGTNGKGSFCVMLSNILTDAGYKTGLYTSPYILNFNERIQIDGKKIPNDALCSITDKVRQYADEMEDKPTEFELITAIAFEYFAQSGCDIVVLECGLGGRFDATNVITNTVLSVITSVSLDHTAFLGKTVIEIAKEKAGIIKGGVPCLYCQQNDEIKALIEAVCKEQGSLLHTPTKTAENIRYSVDKTVFDCFDKKEIILSLLGCYQPTNAVNVLTAIEILNSMGYCISEQNIRNGLKTCVWHARFEVINNDPLIIFDGGHNEEGVTAAVESAKQYLGNTKVNIITGVMKDKDYNFIAKKIGEIANKVFCITPDNPRSLSAKEFSDVFNGMGVEAYDSEGVLNALQSVLNEDTPTLCLGSLYMYKEVTDSLNKIRHSVI